MLYNYVMANTSAIWQQIVYPTYQLLPPSCSTRAIQKDYLLTKTLKNVGCGWGSGERAISRQMTRQKEHRKKEWNEQPWDSRQDEGKHQTLDGGGRSSREDPSVTAAEWLSRYSLFPFYFNRQTTVSMLSTDEKVSYNVAKPAWEFPGPQRAVRRCLPHNCWQRLRDDTEPDGEWWSYSDPSWVEAETVPQTTFTARIGCVLYVQWWPGHATSKPAARPHSQPRFAFLFSLE